VGRLTDTRVSERSGGGRKTNPSEACETRHDPNSGRDPEPPIHIPSQEAEEEVPPGRESTTATNLISPSDRIY